MTQDPRQPAGDYGYDLAHEEVTAGTAPSSPPPAHPQAARPGPRPEAPTGDYEYDEAHDF
jgi:hypothetical protein